MEAPLITIIAGGFIAEFMIGWAVLASVALVAIAIAAVAGTVVYVKCLRDAYETSRAWLANMIISPLLGTALGYLVIALSWNAGQADTHVNEKTPLFVFTVLVGMYGFFVAPFVSPWLLMAGPDKGPAPRRSRGRARAARYALPAQVMWALSAWGMVALGTTHHLVHW
jgi:hypothetical protein